MSIRPLLKFLPPVLLVLLLLAMGFHTMGVTAEGASRAPVRLESITAPVNTATMASLSTSHSGGSFGYSFEPVTIGGDSTSGVRTRVDAMVGVPAGNAPRPVVFLLHDTHRVCLNAGRAPGLSPTAVVLRWPAGCDEVRSDRPQVSVKNDGSDWIAYEAGLTYLGNALRRAGFVTVSLDISGVQRNAGAAGQASDDRRAGLLSQLIGVHQDLLASFHAGHKHGLAMPANTPSVIGQRYFVVGHGTSASQALARAAANTDPHLLGTVAIQPTTGFGLESAAATPGFKPRPTLAYFSTCDERVGPQASRNSLRDFSQRNPDLPFASFAVLGGSHRGVNSSMTQGAVFAPGDKRGHCQASGAVLAADDMRRGLAAGVVSFAEQVTDGSSLALPSAREFPLKLQFSRGLDARAQHGTLDPVDLSAPSLQHVREHILATAGSSDPSSLVDQE